MVQVYNTDYFIDALERLSFKLISHNIKEEFDFYIIGGFCLMLHGLRSSTMDIDSYLNLEVNIKKLISEVGIEIGNPDWLNQDINHLDTIPKLESLLKVETSFTLNRKIGQINIHIAALKTVLFTKVIAATSRQLQRDIRDILSITARTGISEKLLDDLSVFEGCDFDILSSLLSILYENTRIDEAIFTRLYEYISDNNKTEKGYSSNSKKCDS